MPGLTIMHDQLVHVVTASADFTVVAHIRPEDFGPITDEMRKEAEYTVRFSFPKAGKFLIAADAAAKGHPFSQHFTEDVPGSPRMGSFVRNLCREKSSVIST